MRERARVRGDLPWLVVSRKPYKVPPHPACGHLLPHGEGRPL